MFERDFEHYLKAGHGRAYLIAKENPEKYREAILNACRKDYTFDMQCEGSRAFLTEDLVSLFDDPEPFIKAAIESFASTKIDNVADEIQYLSDLLMEFDQRRIVLRKYLDLWKFVKSTSYSELKEEYGLDGTVFSDDGAGNPYYILNDKIYQFDPIDNESELKASSLEEFYRK